ncbi:hypothetical protein H632_c304p0, partial [Helicosporidium sp. ATCC 50920]
MMENEDPCTRPSEVQPKLRQGRRLRALSEGFNKSVKYALRGVGPDRFASTFPGMPSDVLDVLYDGYRQALHGARVHTEGEFDAVCEETQLSDKLHAIEELCESHLTAQSKNSAAATRALRASLLTVKKAEAEELRRLLEAARARRAELEAELESARAEVASQAAALRPLAEPVEAL